MVSASDARKYLLGGALTCAIVSLLGMCIWSCLYCDYGLNKFLKFNPGRPGIINTLIMCLAILPIFSLAFLLLAFFFSFCNCCKCLHMTFLVIGLIIFVGTFVVEIICIVYGGFDSVKAALTFKNDKLNEYLTGYAASTKKFPTVIPPKINFYEENPNKKDDKTLPDYLPIGGGPFEVCYFKNQEDAVNYVPEKCIGQWNGDRMKDFKDYQKKKLDKEVEKSKDQGWMGLQEYHFDTKRDEILYSSQSFIITYPILDFRSFPIYPSLYLICSIMIGINIVSVVFFVVASFIGCCCKSAKVE